jgi:type IV pilus assembly protein PilB
MTQVVQRQDPKEKKQIKEKIREETIKRLRHKSQEEKASALAKKLNLPYVDLNLIPIEMDVVAGIPEEIAKKGGLAAIYKVGRKLQIAAVDPENYETKKAIEKLTKEEKIDCKLIVVSQDSLDRAWESYRQATVVENFEDQQISLKAKELTEFEKGIHDLIELKQKITEVQTTETLNIIIAGAIKTRASDIHLESASDHIRLRYRIDGVLQDIVHFPKEVRKFIISRIKILSKMKLNVENAPQDGHFTVNLGNSTVNIRVSILPGSAGENIVMRLLDERAIALELGSLGLNQDYLEKIERALAKPSGMVLTTGPTGSGKTTTLYAFLAKVNNPNVKIVTLENPVEYRLEGISQTEVGDEDDDLKFAEGLRAIVRQDPDIIMVGEIRDSETAEVAVQAALTGHIVFSTLHTNDSAGAIPRMLHLGVKPTLIAPAINLVIAQRLVRKLCEHCKEEYHPAEETIKRIQTLIDQMPENSKVEVPQKIESLYRSRGCSKCNFIGYSGRIGVFEMFPVTPVIEKLILKIVSTSEILEAAVQEGMITMKQDGIIKALNGVTSLEEIRRVTGEIFEN